MRLYYFLQTSFMPVSIIFSYTDLTEPTQETVEERVTKRIKKIKRLLPEEKDTVLRVSATKDGDFFIVKIETNIQDDIIISAKDRNIRFSIDNAFRQLKFKLAKEKGKRVSLRNLKHKFKEVKNKIFKKM